MACGEKECIAISISLLIQMKDPKNETPSSKFFFRWKADFLYFLSNGDAVEQSIGKILVPLLKPISYDQLSSIPFEIEQARNLLIADPHLFVDNKPGATGDRWRRTPFASCWSCDRSWFLTDPL